MSTSFPRSCHSRLVILLFIPILLFGCTASDGKKLGPENQPQGTSVPQDESATGGIPSMMGFILDPQGDSVAFALVGGREIATEDGVVSGEFDATTSGWIAAENLGYATGYGMPWSEMWGTRFFDIRLTPFQSMGYLQPGESILLEGSIENSLYLTADVEADALEANPALVGLAAINPLNVGPNLADFPGHSNLNLAYAFALQAFDADLKPINLDIGQQVAVNLTLEPPPSDEAVIGYFDPESGTWQAFDGACDFGTEEVTCQIDKLDPLFGIFIPAPAEAARQGATTGNSIGFTLGSLLRISTGSLPFNSPPPQGTNYDPAFQQAWNNLASWMKSQEGAGGIDPNDPTLNNLLNQLANAARNHAKNNRSESGKAHLLKAASAAMSSGNQALSDQLTAETAALVDELARDALKESDCGQFKKLLKVAEQIELTPGANMALHDQLIQKAAEMTVDCDVWDGNITVIMNRADSHPAGLPMDAKSGSWWQERHTVQIWTNVDDFVMHGTDKVMLSFPPITYVKEGDCKSEIKMWGSGGNIQLNFEGKFDGYTFQVNSVTPEGSGGSIQQSWEIQSKENDQCVKVLSTSYGTQAYYSIIAHGLSSDSPPINMQEILDTGVTGRPPGGIPSFSGQEQLVNPDPDLGMFPFHTGQVFWRFTHTQQKLPLEEEGGS